MPRCVLSRRAAELADPLIDLQAITFPDSTFSHVFVNFGIQLFPDPDLAVSGTFSHPLPLTPS